MINILSSIEEGHSARFTQFRIPDFTTAKFHLRTAALLIYYFIALILWPISTVVICLGFPGIAGHSILQFYHWKKRSVKMSNWVQPWVSWAFALGQGIEHWTRSWVFLILGRHQVSNNDVQRQQGVGKLRRSLWFRALAKARNYKMWHQTDGI